MPNYQNSVRVLAVDPGTKRWGIAVGESATGLVRPVMTISGSFDHAIREVVNVFNRERANVMLLGRPVHMDGKEHELTKLSDRAAQFFRSVGIKVIPYDERLTSFSAEQVLKAIKQSFAKNKAIVDRTSAAIMLEDAFRSISFDTSFTN